MATAIRAAMLVARLGVGMTVSKLFTGSFPDIFYDNGEMKGSSCQGVITIKNDLISIYICYHQLLPV